MPLSFNSKPLFKNLFFEKDLRASSAKQDPCIAALQSD